MQAPGLSVFTDTFWTALYERPDLYVTEDMVSRGS